MVDPLLLVYWTLCLLRRDGNEAAAALVDSFTATTRLFAALEFSKFDLVNTVVIARHATKNRGAVVWCGPSRR